MSETQENEKDGEIDTLVETKSSESVLENAETDAGQGQDGEDADRPRRSRPGKLERRLSRASQENEELRRALDAERSARIQYERQLVSLAKNNLSTRKESLAAEEARLTAEAKRTFAEGDADGHTKAASRISELKAEQAEVARRLADVDRRPEAPQEERKEFSETAKQWMSANPWFGRDKLLTTQAQLYHQDAVERGITPDTPAYWRHIRDGVEKFRPGSVNDPFSRASEQESDDDGEEEADSAPAARTTADPAPRAPAPVTRSAAAKTSPPRENMRLTPAQVEIARSIGITPQAYAAGLAKSRADGKIGAR